MSTYNFSEIEKHIIGSYDLNMSFIKFDMFSNDAPSEGDILTKESESFIVESVIDNTTSQEYEEGLSYVKVYLTKL